LTGARVGGLTGARVGGLTGALVGGLTGAFVGGLTGAFVGGLTGAFVGGFTGASVGGLTGDFVSPLVHGLPPALVTSITYVFSKHGFDQTFPSIFNVLTPQVERYFTSLMNLPLSLSPFMYRGSPNSSCTTPS
jgi:hypothetical protein